MDELARLAWTAFIQKWQQLGRASGSTTMQTRELFDLAVSDAGLRVGWRESGSLKKPPVGIMLAGVWKRGSGRSLDQPLQKTGSRNRCAETVSPAARGNRFRMELVLMLRLDGADLFCLQTLRSARHDKRNLATFIE